MITTKQMTQLSALAAALPVEAMLEYGWQAARALIAAAAVSWN